MFYVNHPIAYQRPKFLYATTERSINWLHMAHDFTNCANVFPILVNNSTILAARLAVKG